MRAAGSLRGLNHLGPGDHVCWVVDPDEPYETVARSCLAAGEEANDKVVTFGPDSGRTWPAVHSTDPLLAFLGGGPLQPEAVFEGFRRETEAARRQGYRGLRVVADMDWLLPATPSSDELLSFELRLDAVVNELGATVVCAYRPTTYEASKIAAMVSVHPLDYGAAATDLGFRISHVGGRTFQVTGEVDFANAEAFATALASATVGDGPVHLDVSGLGFIDVAGMRAIAALARRAPDLRLVLEGAAPTFRRCWDLLGYDTAAAGVRFA